jgi:hypothetical protein
MATILKLTVLKLTWTASIYTERRNSVLSANLFTLYDKQAIYERIFSVPGHQYGSDSGIDGNYQRLGYQSILTPRGLNYPMLLAFAAVVGFTGAIFSLLNFFKPMAKWSTGAKVIEAPQTKPSQRSRQRCKSAACYQRQYRHA